MISRARDNSKGADNCQSHDGPAATAPLMPPRTTPATPAGPINRRAVRPIAGRHPARRPDQSPRGTFRHRRPAAAVQPDPRPFGPSSLFKYPRGAAWDGRRGQRPRTASAIPARHGPRNGHPAPALGHSLLSGPTKPMVFLKICRPRIEGRPASRLVIRFLAVEDPLHLFEMRDFRVAIGFPFHRHGLGKIVRHHRKRLASGIGREPASAPPARGDRARPTPPPPSRPAW